MARRANLSEERLVCAITVAGLAASEDLAGHLANRGFDDIRASDWPILRLLLERGPMTASALARPLEITQQATSKAVASLEFRDYVVRLASDGDRRVRDVLLTNRGHAAIESAAQWAAAWEAQAVTWWGLDDVRRITAVLHEFAASSDRFSAAGRNLRPRA